MSYFKKQAIDQTDIWRSLPLSNEQRRKLWKKLRAEEHAVRGAESSVLPAQPAASFSRGGGGDYDADYTFSDGGESKEESDDVVFFPRRDIRHRHASPRGSKAADSPNAIL